MKHRIASDEGCLLLKSEEYVKIDDLDWFSGGMRVWADVAIIISRFHWSFAGLVIHE